MSLAQAAFLGQTFRMLSRQSQDLYLMECFRGTVIALARRFGVFHAKELDTIAFGVQQDLEATWKVWAHNDGCMRLAAGLYIHDSEFSTTFHYEPLLKHDATRLTAGSSDQLFGASTANQWHTILKRRQGPADANQSGSIPMLASRPCSSQIHAHAVSAGHLAVIQEARISSFTASYVQRGRESLLQWYANHFQHVREARLGRSSLMILWHTAFVTLYADIDLLERYIGRDGTDADKQITNDARGWANSFDAQLGAIHALLIQKHAESLSFTTEPLIHVPKALFYSGLIIYCYLKLKRAHGIAAPLHGFTDEEFRLPQSCEMITNSYDGSLISMRSKIDLGVLCSCIGFLRRGGHWGISQRYASILEALLEDLA